MNDLSISKEIIDKIQQRLLVLFVNHKISKEDIEKFILGKKLIFALLDLYQEKSTKRKNKDVLATDIATIVESIKACLPSKIPEDKKNIIDKYKEKANAILYMRSKPNELRYTLMSLFLCYDTCDSDIVKIIKLFLFEGTEIFEDVTVQDKISDLSDQEQQFITAVQKAFLEHISQHWTDVNFPNTPFEKKNKSKSGTAYYYQNSSKTGGKKTDQAQTVLQTLVKGHEGLKKSTLKILIQDNQLSITTLEGISTKDAIIFKDIAHNALKTESSDFEYFCITKNDDPNITEIKNTFETTRPDEFFIKLSESATQYKVEKMLSDRINLFFKFIIPNIINSNGSSMGSFYIVTPSTS